MDVLLLRDECAARQPNAGATSRRPGPNLDHTCNLYRVDEALSALQKAIRRSDTEAALYWAAELDRSGYHRATMQRLVLIGSEDVGLAQPCLPGTMWMAFRDWEAEKKAGREGEPVARGLILGLCGVLAAGPKSRSACLAAAFAVRAVDAAVTAGAAGLGAADCAACGFGHLHALRAAAELARGDLKHEEEALMHLQLVLYEPAGWDWEKHVWEMLLTLRGTSDLVHEGIRALRTLDEAIEGTERLRIFHALMLYTRERFLATNVDSALDERNTSEAVVTAAYSRGRHPTGVPLYCVDKHTLRGHGTGPGDVVYGRDSTADLPKAARFWKLDTSDWSAEEVARSHGPGRRWPRHRCVGFPTMMSQFFDEGCVVHPERFPGPPLPPPIPGHASMDPMHAAAREFALRVEEADGPVTRPSKYVLQRLTHWRSANPGAHFHAPAPLTSQPPTATLLRKKKANPRVQGGW